MLPKITTIDLLRIREVGLTFTLAWHQDASMRTTLNINDALLKELRQKAVQDGRPFRRVVEETIALGLARQAGTPSPAKKFEVKTHPLNIKPGFRSVSFNQLYDQFEAEDAAR